MTSDETMVRIAELRVAGVLRRRDGEYEVRHSEVAAPFVARIEALAAALAARPRRV